MPRIIPCPECDRKFADPDALAMHALATHRNPNWTPGKPKAQRATPPLCPRCGHVAKVTATQYGPRAECCGLHSWALKPLVDKETHAARNAAHAAFDPLWQKRGLGRGEAYRRLQLAMNLSSEDCHIAVMTAAQAMRVVEIVNAGLLMEMA